MRRVEPSCVGHKGMSVVCWDARRFLQEVRDKKRCSQLCSVGGFEKGLNQVNRMANPEKEASSENGILSLFS